MELSEESKSLLWIFGISIFVCAIIIMLGIRFYDNILRIFSCCKRARDTVTPETFIPEKTVPEIKIHSLV
jgi:hypothetical protein